MGQKMSYLQAALLGHALGRTIWTPPATVYVVASTAVFDPGLTGASVPEPADTAYARIAVANDTSHFTTPSGADPTSVSNSTSWTYATATADWGTILSIYLADAATKATGNLLYGTAVPGAGFPCGIGTTLAIAVGTFLVRES